MTNHYHLLVETVEANLSQGTWLNGVYTQYFNPRHKLIGHVLQGRYKAILVRKENYLLKLARYIVRQSLPIAGLSRPEWARPVRSHASATRFFLAMRPSFRHISNRSVPQPSEIRQGSNAALSRCH